MNNLRVGGLATGMDLEGIVKDMMRVQQMRADRLTQQKTTIEWQREAYQNINKTFANFILDTQKTFGLVRAGTTGLFKQSVSSLDWVKTASVHDGEVLAATARADGVAGTYQVNVKQLATNWSSASADKVAGTLTLEEGESISFSINGWKFSTKTIDELGEDVDYNRYSHISASDEIRLSDIVKAINQASIGATAHFDEGTGRFFLQTTDTGANNQLEIIDESIINDAGFITGEDSYLKLSHNLIDENGNTISKALLDGVYKGKNAVIDFGAAENMEFNGNQFSLNGINLNLKSVGATSISIDTDIDGIYNKIVDFVEQYNEIIDQVQSLIGERKAGSYQPLTDEQREQLSEKEIEKWEDKAKQGLLSRDMYLTQVLQQMRSSLYEQVQGVSGEYHISNFGITTQQYVSGSMGGKLQIDEVKLKTAIKEDPNGVLELFFSQPGSDVTDNMDKKAQTGVISRIYNDLTEGMKTIISKAGPGEDAALYRNVDSRMLLDFVVDQGSISFLEKDITRLDQRLSNFQAQMLRVENRYWAQFTALEKAINQLNAQSAWLAQQFGGGMF